MRDKLDPTQLEAMRVALTQNVGLIQGPPGTGKTHVGAAVAEVITRCGPNINILVVCYTNHALDQFLESLLDKGIEEIVRIGSKSKSKRLEPYNLFELSRSQGHGRSIHGRIEWELRNQGDIFKEKVWHFMPAAACPAPASYPAAHPLVNVDSRLTCPRVAPSFPHRS
jgi:hypothetical protein